MKPAIIPGFGIVAGFGLSGANCLLVPVSTITIEKAKTIQKLLNGFFVSCLRRFTLEIGIIFVKTVNHSQTSAINWIIIIGSYKGQREQL
ncbi:hypothetical protein [Lactiplantibacillus paraxiangfangensis]|uniref:hypothetical protein n=1 Tax=Lactiplantibacillus paraxiangfangensis TaxID=3076224 RepID=UPI0030C6F2C5